MATPNASDLIENDPTLPAVIFHESKACFAIDFKGVKTVWPMTIEQSKKKLGDKMYFQINRHCMVHRAAIRAIRPYNVKHIKIELKVSCPIELITSRRVTVFFKAWISNK